MGFDNECILNIQSLAGEYFCPVCRLLVYPDEALQSQCTHLYCKPCLTYITSTTRACPYDGYLVTEADSKPLTESNKALTETIGKITVHCLYHRSGCTWQGPLSECTSHCSGCSFGNSPVVCNRCGIQIVHRQVQEHAQNCPVVQTQAHGEGVQDATATATTPAGDHTQVATQAGTAVTQAHSSQTMASSVPGQDSNQQGNPTTQPQSVVQAAVPTAEQWYQQQQQYQQYYQHYPGFDPYLQHYQQYYPYQQQAVQQYTQPQASQPQSQVQPQGQLQTQPQSHPYIQLTANQPQSLPQANSQQQIHSAAQPQSQIQSQTHPPTQGQLRPQPQLLPQTLPVHHHPQHVPVPQYQQPHSQIQHLQTQIHPQHPVALPLSQGLPHTHAQPPVQPPPQPYTPQLNQPVNPHLQPQPQHSSAHAVTGHHSYPQPQSLQQMQPGGQQNPAHLYPQGGLQLQLQYSVQMQNQLLQRPPPLRPSQSHVPIQNPQQSGLFPPSGQVPGVPPSQQQPVYSNAQQPGVPAHQRPVMQSAQQPIHQQYVQQQQQPFAGQAPGSVHNQVHQQGAYAHQQMHVQSQLRPQGPSPSFQQPYQAQNFGGKPMMPPHGVPVQPHPHSSVGMQVKPMQVGTGQQSGNPLMINNPAVLSSEQHLGATSRSMSDRQSDHIIEKDTEAGSTSQKNYNRTPNDVDVTRGLRPDSNEVKTIKSEGYLKPLNDDKKPIDGEKDTTESPGAENGERSLKVKEEPTDDTDEQKDISNTDYKQVELSVSEGKEMKDRPPLKTHQLQEGERFEGQSMKLKDINLTPQPSLHGQVQGEGLVQPSHLAPIADQGKQHAPPIPHGPTALQQWPVGPGQSHHMQLPGHSPAPPRPVGTENIPHSGQPLRLPAENLQQPPYKQPYGPEVSPAGIAGQGSTSVFERGQSHYGSQGPYAQGEQIQSYGRESDMFTNQRSNYTDGRRLDPLAQQSGRHSNAMRMNGAPGTDSSPALGLQGDRFRPLPEEHLNPFPQDPTQRMIERREFEDLKLFPRPSHLDNESSNFLSSRPLDRRPHGFGMDKPLDKGQHGLNYESGMKLETLGGPAPSRFFPPHPHDGIMHSSELGERPLGLHDKTLGRQPDSGRTHHDFFGPVPRHDMAPRSPVRDYPGVPSHGFGALPGLDDIGGRGLRRFGDSFHGSRYPVLPNHFHRGEFEGPGQDGFPSHLRRDEHLGPHNLHGRFGEPIGFDACPGPARIGELPGPGNFFHAQLGGPGFRSSFSHKGFPSDGGNYARDLESFDNSRRRKPSSMGWCRICKIDCETVEGLDLHSQTREHQKKTMDMVVTIKQNAKKQKIASSDRSSLDDTSKSKNASFEGCGNKN